jgi:protein TonB
MSRKLRVTIGVLVLAVASIVLSQSQGTQTVPDGTTKPATKKSVAKPPEVIYQPDLAPVNDHGTNTTVFTVTVGADGLVHDPRMIESSGNRQADANALEAVKKWRFKPATKDGVPVPAVIKIRVNLKVM